MVQGLSTGAAAGAVGAGMLDLDRAKGTIANAVGPMLGTATGALLSGLMVQYLPAPTPLVYLVLGAIFVVQAIGVVAMPESATPRPGALASLRPQFRLPPQVRAADADRGAGAGRGVGARRVLRLARADAGRGSPARPRPRSAASRCSCSPAAARVTVLLTRTRTSRGQMTFGTAALLVAFQGGVRSIVAQAGAHERAGVLSIVYVVAYLAMGVPAVLAGLRVVHGGGLLVAARELGVVVMALAAIALAGTVARRFRPAP